MDFDKPKVYGDTLISDGLVWQWWNWYEVRGSVFDQELDFTMDIKVRDNRTDRELPDDIGTQMVFMSQREGRPDHFL